MKFTENTTSLELMNAYRDSVFSCLQEIEDMVNRLPDLQERDRAYKTRKIILRWFDRFGGL
jgi:hypothetical protein